MDTYHVIGLMSGSSLDGLDIAFCRIEKGNDKWSYEILNSECISYPPKWKLRLSNLVMQNAITYLKTHYFYGHYIGELVNDFIDKFEIREKVEFIASHGQTIFHQPENRLTSQIGDGAAIAATTGIPVVSDFRTIDIALEGEGTPITPIADKLLFPEHKYFMNLGGICNIGVHDGDKVFGFDICPTNLVLNRLASEKELPYDDGGYLASLGKYDASLFKELNTAWYYDKDYPKSLSGGWVNKVMMPMIKRHVIPTENKMRTVVEHIAFQIGESLKRIELKEGIKFQESDKLYVSGGGALNDFLIGRIRNAIPIEVVVADLNTLNFKEALMIGLMGVLRVRNEVNVLSSVTGSSRDNIGGCIYQGSNRTI